MADYYTLLTNAGIAYETACKAAGLPIKLLQISVGDGNGAIYNPAATATALKREVWRGPLNALFQDEKNPNWLLAEVTIPPEVGGWYVREAGIWTDTGVLYAIVKYPESFKPVLATSGSGKEFYIRSIFETSNASAVTLLIDDTIVRATRAWVSGYLADELAKRDHKQSVRVVATQNIELSGAQQIGAVAAVAGDRVGVVGQTAGKDNGIWIVSNAAWVRSSDANSSEKVTAGLSFAVEEGAVNGGSLWQLVTKGSIVLGVTELVFEMLAGKTGVMPGSYRMFTVDKYGRVLAGSNPTTLSGFGITDAMPIGAGGLMTSAPGFSGAISELPSTQFFHAAEGNVSDIPVGMSNAVGLHVKYPGPVGKYAFDIISSVTGEDFRVRYVGAGGPAEYRRLWHSGNFDPASKMAADGGGYRPRFASAGVGQDVAGYQLQGGYIGWGNAEANMWGTMQFVCNRGTGNGGFMWRSVNSDNTQTGPVMSYSYDGWLTVPSLKVLGNTEVPTQYYLDKSKQIANTEFVKSWTSQYAARDWVTTVGVASGDKNQPYMRLESTGELVMLQPLKQKNTALLAQNGWSKDADTGEIVQWFEYAQGDYPVSLVMNVTWPFQFPNQFLNAKFSLKMPNGQIQCATQVSYSGATVSGCALRLEEWGGAVQTGMVIVIEVRGF